MIEVRNLTKHYGPTRSIENVTFSVEKGEILGFLGPNGAGKSTTMRLLVGLQRPTAGHAAVGGFDVQRDNARVRTMIGYLPEMAPLYGDMTLAGYLEFMGGMRGLGPREARREMERTTGLLNLGPERRRLLRNLSKGTRQRAAIAQALLGDPPILILDEPTVGLDPTQNRELRELIRSFKDQRTVILSTHILPEVELTCSRIAIIANGRLVSEGLSSDLVARAGSVLVLRVRGDRAAAEAAFRDWAGAAVRPEVDGNGNVTTFRATHDADDDARARLVHAMIAAGLDVLDLHTQASRLEDVFLGVIGSGTRGGP